MRFLTLLILTVPSGALLAAAQPDEPKDLPPPCVFEPLNAWISDSDNPVRVVMNSPASRSLFSHEVKFDAYAGVVRHTSIRNARDGSFGYRFLGVTKSGIQGYLTNDNGGGSGTFLDAIFLRPETVRIGNLDLASVNSGEFTLPIETRPAWRILSSAGCGDRTVCEFRMREDAVDIAVVDPREPVKEGDSPKPTRFSIEFSSSDKSSI